MHQQLRGAASQPPCTARLHDCSRAAAAESGPVRKQVENNSIGGFIEDLCLGSARLLLPECLRETKEKHDLKGHRAIYGCLYYNVESSLYYLEFQFGWHTQTLHRLGVDVTTTTLHS